MTRSMVKNWVAFAAAVSLSACNAPEVNAPAATNPAIPTPDAPDTPTVVAAKAMIKHDGEVIAYVIDVKMDEAVVYIPSVSRYTEISLSTGKYTNNSTRYFSEPDGEGTTYVSWFVGEIGKAVIYSKLVDRYYIITNWAPDETVVQSALYNGAIQNITPLVTGTDQTMKVAEIEETSRPYNFESIAPIALSFE